MAIIRSKSFLSRLAPPLEDSPIPLEKWLPAVWLLVSCKNGVSSYEIAAALGITQKSAWFMMHRIRRAMQCGSFRKLHGGDGGEVEADKTFIGGEAGTCTLTNASAVSLGQAAKIKPPLWESLSVAAKFAPL